MAQFPTFKGSWPWLWPWISHTAYCHASLDAHRPLCTYQISLKSKETVCAWTDRRTYRRTSETHFIGSTRRSRPKKTKITAASLISSWQVFDNVSILLLWCCCLDGTKGDMHLKTFGRNNAHTISGGQVYLQQPWKTRPVRCSSKMKPRFRAAWEVTSEEWCILTRWFLSPMSKNSVLENLRVRRSAVIQEEMCWRAFWRREMLD